ncbi:MAG: flagellar filament capping protein FliD, partial [Alphaproteobacteria bacterium]
ELQAARKAQFHADGLLDSTSHTSETQSSAVTALGVASTLTFADTSGTLIGTLAYTATDTLTDIANNIAGDVTLAGAGISASIVANGSGSDLSITGSTGFNLSDSSTLLGDVGVAKDDLIIERDSNTISDLFDGVTLTLFQSEVGTTINFDIERDLTAVKTGVVAFVDAYNALRQELNIQLNIDSLTGEVSEDSSLFGNPALEEIDSRIEEIIGSGASGVSGAFSVLAQIGIDFVSNGELEDQTLRDTLEINEESFDEALLNNPDDVKKLFQFEFSSSDPRVVLLDFQGTTTHKSEGYTLDIDYDEIGGELGSVTLDDGTGVVDGQGITIDSGGAKGLKLFYSGDTDISGITLDFSVGFGAKLFFELEEMLDQTDGLIVAETDNLSEQNELAEERSIAMLDRLDRERDNQLAKFVRMETALATMNALLDQITQITDAMFQDR